MLFFFYYNLKVKTGSCNPLLTNTENSEPTNATACSLFKTFLNGVCISTCIIFFIPNLKYTCVISFVKSYRNILTYYRSPYSLYK